MRLNHSHLERVVRKIWNFITGLKNATGNILFLLLVVGIVLIIFSREAPSVPDSAVLIISPEGVLVEQKQAVDPVEQFLAGDEAQDRETLSRDITDAIDLAATDDRIKAIALDLSRLQGGSLSIYEDIGRELVSFQDQGKPVYAFGTSYSQSQYYLAAHADRVYVDSDGLPTLGGVFMQGLDMYPLYVKSALDKLQVSIHVFKAGLYKNAAETFIRDDMSDYSREANQELLGALWGSFIATIARQREVDAEAIADYINNYPDLIAESDNDPITLAIERGFIDAAISREEWRQEMKAISGEHGDTYNHVDFRQYLSAVRPAIPVNNPARDKIAVIVAKGVILDGDQPAGTVGGETIARLVREARNDKSIKAVVLRVDSGGGSVTASELIRSELEHTQQTGKPVVASMGGYAASGGYWISSTANRIFASETTITGSIGVFGLFWTLQQSAAELGVHADGIGTTEFAGSFNPFIDLNPALGKTLEFSVARTYRKFLELVSQGRGLSIEEADAVGQGRVWTGARAVEHGLVDAIGNLDDAIVSAAMLADLDDYDVIFMEKKLSTREQLLQQLMQTSVNVLPGLPAGAVALVSKEIRQLTTMVQSPGIYLQCMTCNIRF
jgi:protease-4